MKPLASSRLDARDRLLTDLRIAGFRVTASSFAKSLTAPAPNLFTYDIHDGASGAFVTRVIIETLGEAGIQTFYLSTSETIAEDVAMVIDIAGQAVRGPRA